MRLEELIPSKYSGVVAAEAGGDAAVLYIRDTEKGSVKRKEIPFKPFLLMNNPALLSELNAKFDIKSLSGDAPFAYMTEFTDTATWQEAVKFLKKNTGFPSGSPNSPYKVISDFRQQLFVSEAFRLFRGMNFENIKRMQFDIETLTAEGYEFPNPERESDSVIIISMSDSTGWEKLISADNMSEKELLEEFVKTVAERDPDVLEGHNIFKFDLPFIETRAKRHKVKLKLGRDGSVVRKRNSRLSAAERTINYTRYDAYGRHFVDTLHLVQFYDISHRDLENYGLKYVARHFGVAPENRTYIEGPKIPEAWRNDREKLLRYALDDARETRAVSDILSPSYFYQTQLIPMSYQDCVVRGNATRIDSLLVAEYLRKGASIPSMEQGRPFAGALTEAVLSGVFENVWHCDVRSLYPSIILAEKWCPERDHLKIFPALLRKLREFRLEAKDMEKKASSREAKDFYNSLQTTFKILINSFYGYLGFSQGTFNDFEMAEKVTARGREILKSMFEFLKKSGANVIEMDTDGIYFQPPSGVSDTEKMQKMIQDELPSGIEVELDATYPAMFCYKSKNYALLNHDGEISITGAALKSRGIEPFQRDFIKELLELLLNGRASEIAELAEKYREDIEKRKMPLEKLAKTETLNDSPELYSKKLSSGNGRRSAAYELAIASDRDYAQGDQVSYYITGEKKKVAVVDNSVLLSDAPEERNENTTYYIGKIDELYKKFSEFIPDAPEASAHGDTLNLDFS